MHPTQENLSLAKDDNIIDATTINQEKNNSEEVKLLTMLERMKKISTIGTLNGDKGEIFGLMKDIVIDAFHRIYILDSHKQLIGVFSQKGAHIASLGGKGKGPGEFEFAKSMANYNNKLLLVNNGHRIEVYSIESENIEFVKTIRLKKGVDSICTLGDTLFIHNTGLFKLGENIEKRSSANMIQAYKLPSFKRLFSFGQPYKSANPMVVNRMSSGSMSCNKASSTVIIAFKLMPVLRGYAAKDGHLKWKSRIDGLHFPTVTQTDKGGRTRLTFKTSNITDWIIPTVSFSGKHEILQVRRRIATKQSYGSEGEVLTFLLNAANGKGRFLSKDISGIANISNRLIATISEDYLVSRIYSF